MDRNEQGLREEKRVQMDYWTLEKAPPRNWDKDTSGDGVEDHTPRGMNSVTLFLKLCYSLEVLGGLFLIYLFFKNQSGTSPG